MLELLGDADNLQLFARYPQYQNRWLQQVFAVRVRQVVLLRAQAVQLA